MLCCTTTIVSAFHVGSETDTHINAHLAYMSTAEFPIQERRELRKFIFVLSTVARDTVINWTLILLSSVCAPFLGTLQNWHPDCFADLWIPKKTERERESDYSPHYLVPLHEKRACERGGRGCES